MKPGRATEGSSNSCVCFTPRFSESPYHAGHFTTGFKTRNPPGGSIVFYEGKNLFGKGPGKGWAKKEPRISFAAGGTLPGCVRHVKGLF
jgi:hypothetical protein